MAEARYLAGYSKGKGGGGVKIFFLLIEGGWSKKIITPCFIHIMPERRRRSDRLLLSGH